MGLPPGPRTPAVVQGVRFLRDPLGFLVRAHRRHGDLFTISLPYFGRLVYVADPAIVKQVFTGDPSIFHSGEATKIVLGPALGPNSVLTLDDEPHMRQRKLLLPPFHGKSVERYGELILEVAEQEMKSWPVGEPFALHDHTHRITLAVILRAVFGVHDEERVNRASVLINDFAHRANPIIQLPWLRGRNFGPWPKFQRARAALDEFIYEEIAARRAAPDREERDDVLSLLLGARYDDGSPMGDEELRDELVTVIGAGHETTATALAWGMERLLRTPRVLAKLRESIAAGEDDYLDATVKETLRARPVISEVARRLVAPAEVGGYELPAKTFVLPAIAAMHYSEELFPEPEEFRPERFLDTKVDNYAWIPFGGGIRRCIGAAFAEYEMRIILRAFIEHADLSAPDPKAERIKIRHITLAPGKGARVKLDRPLR